MASRRLKIRLQPEVLRWARERAVFTHERLAGKLGVRPEAVLEWERSGRISVAQADKLADHTHTPLGFLYLTEPPEDRLPIPDLRTRDDDAPPGLSPDLLETVYLMQRRQLWMRDEIIEEGGETLGFVGACGLDSSPRRVAAAMREALDLTHGWAAAERTWVDGLRRLRDRVEEAGVLVVFSGVVGNNTRRKLDREEFQGFALVDEYAPLVFVNSSDFKAAQMFTLAHELVHIFVGEAGVSSLEALQPSRFETERFCNRTAAEFLVPEEELRTFWQRTARQATDPYQSVARRFKVSSLVAARRALDLGLIPRETFFEFYDKYRDNEWRLNQRRESNDGGNFWNTQKWRVGPRFGAAVARAVKEGRLSYREAYRLTGLRGDTFERMPQKMRIVL